MIVRSNDGLSELTLELIESGCKTAIAASRQLSSNPAATELAELSCQVCQLCPLGAAHCIYSH